jgi:hypothetical protein
MKDFRMKDEFVRFLDAEMNDLDNDEVVYALLRAKDRFLELCDE